MPDPNTDRLAQAANGVAERDLGRARDEREALERALDGFLLTFRNGGYRVSLPNLNVGDGMEVVPKERAERAEAQLAEARRALEFYAEKAHYFKREVAPSAGFTPALIADDQGERARAALVKLGESSS